MRKWDFDVVGVLASENDLYNEINRDSNAFINSNNNVQFYVKPISNMPESFLNVRLFTGFASSISQWFDEYNYDPTERIKELKKFLDDKLIIFSPIRKGEYNNMDDVRICPKPAEYYDGTTYVPIPIFSSRVHKININEFEEKLSNGKFVGRIEKISTETEDTPEIILWDKGNDDYTIYGTFESHRYAHGGFQFSNEEIKKGQFQEQWYEDISRSTFNDSIVFIGINTLNKIREYLSEHGILLLQNKENDMCENINVQIGNEVTETNLENIDSKEEIEDDLETKFLSKFIQLTKSEGFVYEEKDLINFHTAMKSSNLVILAGMSGTGKSKLVSLYGKALELSEEQLKIIPVSPSWTEDADLIGYLDTTHMLYRSADSGLLDTLIDAGNKDNLYIICFDEMNLARVEHYFSQFLSILEMDTGRRYLRLYNNDMEFRGVYNSSQYHSKIEIGENVIFVGTVNLDESTYHFSDKVLDRANVITLNVRPFKDLQELNDELKPKNEDKLQKLDNKEKMSFREYKAFKKGSLKILELFPREVEFLTELHQLLQSNNKNLGVGFRIVRNIDCYLKNLPKGDLLTRHEAFDLQIIQRIMTKVRGPEEQLRGLLGTIKLENNEIIDSELLDVVNKFEDISEFTQTRRLIEHKAKELKLYGYTI